MSDNAYRPPSSDTPPRRSYVRGILAVLIGLAGVGTIAGNGFLLGHRIFIESAIPWRDVPWSFAVWEIELRVVAMLIGAVWICSAVMILRNSWRAGLALAVVNCVLLLANPEISHELRREFAGDHYTIEVPDGRGGTETATVQIP